MKNIFTSNDSNEKVLGIIKDSEMSSQARTWFEENSKTLSDIVDLYAREGSNPAYKLDPRLAANPEMIVKTMIKFADRIVAYQNQYDDVLTKIAKQYGVSAKDKSTLAITLEKETHERLARDVKKHIKNDGKVMLAISGPGGVGKDTITFKVIASGIPKAVNATTREDRKGSEVHGEDYTFLRIIYDEDIDNFTGIGTRSGKNRVEEYCVEHGGYVVCVVKPDGRATHLTTVNEVKRVFANSDVAVLIHAITEVIQANTNIPKHVQKVKTVSATILPPNYATLVARFVARTMFDPKHTEQESDGPRINDGVLSSEDFIKSTIGPSQFAEIESSLKMKKAGIDGAFIVNDVLHEAVEKVRRLVV